MTYVVSCETWDMRPRALTDKVIRQLTDVNNRMISRITARLQHFVPICNQNIRSHWKNSQTKIQLTRPHPQVRPQSNYLWWSNGTIFKDMQRLAALTQDRTTWRHGEHTKSSLQTIWHINQSIKEIDSVVDTNGVFLLDRLFLSIYYQTMRKESISWSYLCINTCMLNKLKLYDPGYSVIIRQTQLCTQMHSTFPYPGGELRLELSSTSRNPNNGQLRKRCSVSHLDRFHIL